MKTALRPENFDERSTNVVKMENYAIFKFILRLDNVPTRLSLRLTRSHSFLTTRMITRAPRPMRSYYVLTAFLLRPIRSEHALTMRLPRSHCVRQPSDNVVRTPCNLSRQRHACTMSMKSLLGFSNVDTTSMPSLLRPYYVLTAS